MATFNQLPSLLEKRHLEISVALQSLDDSLIDNAPCMYTVFTLASRKRRSWDEASEGMKQVCMAKRALPSSLKQLYRSHCGEQRVDTVNPQVGTGGMVLAAAVRQFGRCNIRIVDV